MASRIFLDPSIINRDLIEYSATIRSFVEAFSETEAIDYNGETRRFTKLTVLSDSVVGNVAGAVTHVFSYLVPTSVSEATQYFADRSVKYCWGIETDTILSQLTYLHIAITQVLGFIPFNLSEDEQTSLKETFVFVKLSLQNLMNEGQGLLKLRDAVISRLTTSSTLNIIKGDNYIQSHYGNHQTKIIQLITDYADLVEKINAMIAEGGNPFINHSRITSEASREIFPKWQHDREIA